MGRGPVEIDYGDVGYWSDPHPILRAARERHPLARSSAGYWLVLRHADVEPLLGAPELRVPGIEILHNQGIRSGLLAEWWPLILFNTNPPAHTRLRALLGRAFTPRRVEALRPRIRALAHELLDRVAGAGEMDVVGDFAHLLPVLTICELLDVPREDHARFIDWSTELALGLSLAIPPETRVRVERALEQFYAYGDELIAQRRARPGPDLLSALIAAEEGGDRLSTPELRALTVNLLLAGHDTTRGLLGIAVWTLLRHPAALERLRRAPELIAPAVEEVLRFEPVAEGVARKATRELEIGGIEIAKGELLFLSLLAANRDPEAFPEPDRFWIERPDNRHLSFGRGLHFCLGAALARAEAQEGLGVLLERLPRLEALETAGWRMHTANRSLARLRVRFARAA
jgi:cytochrome P450